MHTKLFTLTLLLTAAVAVPASAAPIYLEDFDPTVANQYSQTPGGSGTSFTERSDDSIPFTAALFSNSTYADMRKGIILTTDAINISSYSLDQITVIFELAAPIDQWDDNDTFNFRILDADNSDAILFTLDNLLPGGTNQPLGAYSGAPYAGSETPLSIGLTPSFLTYDIADYVTTETTNSIKIQLYSIGSSLNDNNGLGSITVTAIPEPSTVVLGLLAMGSVLLFRRRK